MYTYRYMYIDTYTRVCILKTQKKLHGRNNLSSKMIL